jgi:hypothetical protein
MLGIAAESPASGARFVGWRAIVQDALAVKEPACIKSDKLLHELFPLATLEFYRSAGIYGINPFSYAIT